MRGERLILSRKPRLSVCTGPQPEPVGVSCPTVSPITAALVTFASTFGCALLATYVRGRLPPAHLSKESQDVVRLGIGLVATMTALLLGLVTAAARGTFDAQDAG